MKNFNNKKAFTLTELIAVIVVLAITSTIVFPVIQNHLKDNKNKLYEMQIDGIVESAKIWGANNINKLPVEGEESVTVTLGELKRAGYADKDLKNPKTDKLFNDEQTKVIISNENGILYYNVIVE